MDLFRDLARRGLDLEVVELGIMDEPPGLEAAFQAAFAKAQTQRCQVHPKPNILRRVSMKDREASRKDLDAVFYAQSESKVRRAFSKVKV